MDIQAIIFGRDAVSNNERNKELFGIDENVKKTLFKLQQRGYKLAAIEPKGNEKNACEADVLLSTAKTLGVPPHECAVVEDATTGIDAAKSNGMTAIGIGKAKNYIFADMCIREISELLDIFA